jgi:formate dehydrogenase major subunit
VQGKDLYIPLNSRDGLVNLLTSSNVDRATHTPAYKETTVRLRTLPHRGPNPLRRDNFRYRPSPTPQQGVEVERKWKKQDYRMPGTGLVQIQSAHSSGENANGATPSS